MVNMKAPVVVAVATVSLLGACYSYRPAGPVDTVTPEQGTRVNLTLTSEGVAMFANQLGPQATYVEGDVIEADPSMLRIAVRRVEDARRTGAEWKGEQVTFPRTAVASVRERHFMVGATAIVSGLAVGGVIGAYAAFGLDGTADGVAIPPGNPSQ